MSRALFIGALMLTASLASANSAAAEDCMCIVPELGLLRHAPQSVEIGPVFSSDGTMLSSRVLEPGQRRKPPEDVLWCMSPDDPRCSPRDQGPDHGPRVARGTFGGAAAESMIALPPAPHLETMKPGARGGPRPGFRLRIERPPRG